MAGLAQNPVRSTGYDETVIGIEVALDGSNAPTVIHGMIPLDPTAPVVHTSTGLFTFQLNQNKGKYDKGIETGDEYVANVSDLDMPAGEIFCQEDYENKFRRISRLKRKSPERKPASSSMRHFTDKKKSHESDR